MGVNGSFTFGNLQAYIDYTSGALIPIYRDMAMFVVRINPFLFGLLLRAYEITMGLLILNKRGAVKIGLAGNMLFIVGIAPLSMVQIPWLVFLIAEGYLFGRDFELPFWDMLAKKQPAA